MAVYFIQAESGPIKIGLADNPKLRMQTFQTGHHETLRLARVIDGGANEERWLHQQFDRHHIRGEWFNFVPEMMTVCPPDLTRTSPAPSRAMRSTTLKSAALQSAIDKVGGIAALARALNVTTQAISQWEQPPIRRVLDIEDLTGVPREELRPDIYRKKSGAKT